MVEVELVSPRQQTVQVRMPAARKVSAFTEDENTLVGQSSGANAPSILLQPSVPLKLKIRFE